MPALGAEEVHAGHGSEAARVDARARDQRAFGVHDCDVARPQREAVRPRDAVAVEQGMDGQGIVGETRTFDPHLADQRELLALGIAGAQRKGPRRDAEILAGRDRAEEAGALEDRDVMRRLAALRLQHAEARVADIRDGGRHL